MGGPNIIENIAKFDRWFTSGIRDGYEHDIEQSIRNENMWLFKVFCGNGQHNPNPFIALILPSRSLVSSQVFRRRRG